MNGMEGTNTLTYSRSQFTSATELDGGAELYAECAVTVWARGIDAVFIKEPGQLFFERACFFADFCPKLLLEL